MQILKGIHRPIRKVDSCSKFDFLEKSEGEQECKPPAPDGKTAVFVLAEIQETVFVPEFNRHSPAANSNPSYGLKVVGLQTGDWFDADIILVVIYATLENPIALNAENRKKLNTRDGKSKMSQERDGQTLHPIVGVVPLDPRKPGQLGLFRSVEDVRF